MSQIKNINRFVARLISQVMRADSFRSTQLRIIARDFTGRKDEFLKKAQLIADQAKAFYSQKWGKDWEIYELENILEDFATEINSFF